MMNFIAYLLASLSCYLILSFDQKAHRHKCVYSVLAWLGFIALFACAVLLLFEVVRANIMATLFLGLLFLRLFWVGGNIAKLFSFKRQKKINKIQNKGVPLCEQKYKKAG